MKSVHCILTLLFCITVSAQNTFEVFFDFSKDQPNEISMLHFRDWMKSHNDITVKKLSGYCDSVDVNSYNKELAARRIQSVLTILSENQINVDPNLETTPYGEDFELSKIQAENRKVMLWYEEKEKPALQNTAEKPLSDQFKAAKPGDLIKLRNINFLNNSDVTVLKSRLVMKELLCIMQDNPKLKIEIQGHICCQTTNAMFEISTARAKAVYAYLVRNKIDRKRLSFKGYGNTRPIYPIPEQNAFQEDENRRVEVLIVEN